MKVASFFAGCGGLDMGFRQAGYEVVWANEFDEAIHKTYQREFGIRNAIKKLNRQLEKVAYSFGNFADI